MKKKLNLHKQYKRMICFAISCVMTLQTFATHFVTSVYADTPIPANDASQSISYTMSSRGIYFNVDGLLYVTPNFTKTCTDADFMWLDGSTNAADESCVLENGSLPTKKIDLPENVKDIAISSSYTAVLTDDGNVSLLSTTGSGQSSTFDSDSDVTGISAESDMIFLVTDDNHIFGNGFIFSNGITSSCDKTGFEAFWDLDVKSIISDLDTITSVTGYQNSLIIETPSKFYYIANDGSFGTLMEKEAGNLYEMKTTGNNGHLVVFNITSKEVYDYTNLTTSTIISNVTDITYMDDYNEICLYYDDSSADASNIGIISGSNSLTTIEKPDNINEIYGYDVSTASYALAVSTAGDLIVLSEFLYPNVLADTGLNLAENTIIYHLADATSIVNDPCQSGHTYSVTENTATCETSGVKTETCTICGDIVTTDVEPLGHYYTSAISDGATCESERTETFTCIRCGNTYDETKEAAGHNYEETITDAASCTENGTKTLTCSVCGDTKTELIEKSGHNYTTEIITPSTTTSKGVAKKTCSICGNVVEVDLPMIGNINVHVGHNNLAVHDNVTDYIYFTGECSAYERSMRQENITNNIEDSYGERQLKRAATISGSKDIVLGGNQITIYEPVIMQNVSNSSDEFYLLEDGTFVNLYDYEENRENFVDTISGSAGIESLGFGTYSGLTLGDDGTIYLTFVSTSSLGNVTTGESSSNSIYWTNQLDCDETVVQIDVYPENEFKGETKFNSISGIGSDGYAILTESGKIYTLNGSAVTKMQLEAVEYAHETNEKNALTGDYNHYSSLMSHDIFMRNKENLVLVNSTDMKFSKVTTTPGKRAILAISEEGDIWGFGQPKSGIYTEGKLTNDTIFIDIQAGRNHVIALDNNGHIWSMGKNNAFQCGSGNTQNVTEFTQITDDSLFFVSIGAGDDFSAAVTNTGHLYTWGDNSLNQCGISEAAVDTVNTPTFIADLSHQCVYTEADYVVTKESTCGVSGTVTRTCSECGNSSELTIENLDHIYQQINALAMDTFVTFNHQNAGVFMEEEISAIGAPYDLQYEFETGDYFIVDDTSGRAGCIIAKEEKSFKQTYTDNSSQNDMVLLPIEDVLTTDILKSAGYDNAEIKKINSFYKGLYCYYIDRLNSTTPVNVLVDSDITIERENNENLFIALYETITANKNTDTFTSSYYENASWSYIVDALGYNEANTCFYDNLNREYTATADYFMVQCTAANGTYLVLIPRLSYDSFQVKYKEISTTYTDTTSSINIDSIVAPNTATYGTPRYARYVKVSDPENDIIRGVKYYYTTTDNFSAQTTINNIVKEIYEEDKILNSYYTYFTNFSDLHAFETKWYKGSDDNYFLYQYSSSLRGNYGYALSTGSYTFLETEDAILVMSKEPFYHVYKDGWGITRTVSMDRTNTLIEQLDVDYLLSAGYSYEEINEMMRFFKDIYVYSYPGTSSGFKKLNIQNIVESSTDNWSQIAINYYEQYKDQIVYDGLKTPCGHAFREVYKCYNCGDTYVEESVTFEHVMPRYGNFSLKPGYEVFNCIECNEFLSEKPIHYTISYFHSNGPADTSQDYIYSTNNTDIFLNGEEFIKEVAYDETVELVASKNHNAEFNVIISSPTSEEILTGTLTQTGFNGGLYKIGDTVTKMTTSNGSFVAFKPDFTSSISAPSTIEIEGTSYPVTKWYAFEYRDNTTSTYDYSSSSKSLLYANILPGQPIYAGNEKTIVLVPAEGEGYTKYCDYYNENKESNLEITFGAPAYKWYIEESLNYGDYYSNDYNVKVDIYVQDSNGNYGTPILRLTEKQVYFIGESYYKSYAHIHASADELSAIGNLDIYEIDTARTTTYSSYSRPSGAKIYLKQKEISINVLDEENPVTYTRQAGDTFSLPVGIKKSSGEILVAYYAAPNGRGKKYTSDMVLFDDIVVYPHYVSADALVNSDIVLVDDVDISESTVFSDGSTILIREGMIDNPLLTGLGMTKKNVYLNIQTDNEKLAELFEKSAATAKPCNILTEYNDFSYISKKQNGVVEKTYIVDETTTSDLIKVGNNKVKIIDDNEYYINHDGNMIKGNLVYNVAKSRMQFMSNEKLYDCSTLYADYATYGDIKDNDTSSEDPILSSYMMYTSDGTYRQVYVYTKDGVTFICDANGNNYKVTDNTILYIHDQIVKPVLNPIENKFIYIHSSIWGTLDNDIVFQLDNQDNVISIYELSSGSNNITVNDITDDFRLLNTALQAGRVTYHVGNACGEYLPEIYLVEAYVEEGVIKSEFMNSSFKYFTLPSNEDCLHDNFFVEKYGVSNVADNMFGTITIEITPKVITLDTKPITAYEFRNTTLTSESYESPADSKWYMKYDLEHVENPYWVNAQYSADEKSYYNHVNVKTSDEMDEAIIQLRYQAFQTYSQEELENAKIYIKSASDGSLTDISDSIGIKYQVLEDTNSNIFNGESIIKASVVSSYTGTYIMAISEEGGVWTGTSYRYGSNMYEASYIEQGPLSKRAYNREGTTSTGAMLRKYYADTKFVDMVNGMDSMFFLDENGNIWLSSSRFQLLNAQKPSGSFYPFRQISQDVEFVKLGSFAGSVYSDPSPLESGRYNCLFYAIDKDGYIWYYDAGSLRMIKDNKYSKDTKFIDVASTGYYPYSYAIDEDHNLWIKGQYGNAFGYYNNGIINGSTPHVNNNGGQLVEWTPLNELYTDYKNVKWKSIELDTTDQDNYMSQLGLIDSNNQLWRMIVDEYGYDYSLGYVIAEKNVAKWNGIYTLGTDGNIYLSDTHQKNTMKPENCIYDGGDAVDIADLGTNRTFTKANGEIVVIPEQYLPLENGVITTSTMYDSCATPKELLYWQYDTDHHKEVENEYLGSDYLRWDFAQQVNDFMTLTPEHVEKNTIVATISLSDLEKYDGIEVKDGDKIYMQTEVGDSMFYLLSANETIYNKNASLLTEENRPVADVKSETDITVNNLDIERVTMNMDKAAYYCKSNYDADTTDYYSEKGVLNVVPLVELEATYNGGPVPINTEVPTSEIDLMLLYEDGNEINITYDELTNAPATLMISSEGVNTFNLEYETQNDDVEITGVNSIVSLEATYPESVFVGDEFDPTLVDIVATYADGTTVEPIYDGTNVDKTIHNVGDNIFEVQYDDVKTNLIIQGYYYDRIEASYTGENMKVGSDYEKSDVTVTLYYTENSFNKESEILTEDQWTESALNVTIVGINPYTATFKTDSSLTADYNVIGIDYIEALTAEYIGPNVKVGDQYLKENVNVYAHYKAAPNPALLPIDSWEASSLEVTDSGANKYTASYNSLTADYHVTGYDIDRIEAVYEGDPIPIGKDYEKQDVIVTVYYDDGTSEIVPEDKWETDSTTVTTDGDNPFTATYENKEAPFVVPGYSITGITAIYNGPDIFVGNEYSKDDVTVEIEYGNGEKRVLTSDEWTTDGLLVKYDGENRYTASYGAYKAKYSVTGYREKGIKAIYLGEPIEIGQKYNKNDVTVTIEYTNNTSTVIPTDQWQESSLLVEKLGDNIYTATYNDHETTYEVIGFHNEINAVSIVGTYPESVLVGSDYEEDKAIIVVTYDDGSTGQISYAKLDIVPASKRVTKTGDNTYNIGYRGAEGILTVHGYDITELVAVYDGPDIEVGKDYSKSDVTVKLYYTENKQGKAYDEITDFSCDSLTVTKVGENEYTATYKDMTAKYTVNGIAAVNAPAQNSPAQQFVDKLLPKTGDSTNILLFAFILLMGISVTIIYTKKKRK